MDEIFKLVYTVVVFISLYLVVVNSQSKLILIFLFSYLLHNISFNFNNICLFLFYNTGTPCRNFIHCYKIKGIPLEGVWRCNSGFCELVI